MIVFDVSTVRIDVCAPSVYVASRRPLGSDLSLILCLLPRHDSAGGNYDSRFDVGKASGTLIVARPLDAEQKSSYNLTVEATDGTRSVSTQVTEAWVEEGGGATGDSVAGPSCLLGSVDVCDIVPAVSRREMTGCCSQLRLSGETRINRFKHGK